MPPPLKPIRPFPLNPALFAQLPLYAPLQTWLKQGLTSAEELTAEARRRGLLTGGGQALSFVAATSTEGYELQAFRDGTVETRANNWHDLFGAYVWLAFPRSKAVLNRRHWQALASADGRRGALRDALTQFDECGVVVLCTDMRLWQDIGAHRWREVFAERRQEVTQHLRFLVYGHGSYDALRAPFIGLCGKAVCFEVAALPDTLVEQVALADGLLAQLFEREDLAKQRWQPLPLLGLPGATADNENPAYYDDQRQFRPLRQSHRPSHIGYPDFPVDRSR